MENGAHCIALRRLFPCRNQMSKRINLRERRFFGLTVSVLWHPILLDAFDSHHWEAKPQDRDQEETVCILMERKERGKREQGTRATFKVIHFLKVGAPS